MKELIIKDAIDEYLSVSKYINWDEDNIISKGERFKQKYTDEISLVKAVYEFVRDEVKHSWDVQDKRVTKSATEVLEQESYMYLNCLPDHIFEYKRATQEDLDELVRTRIIVLRAANRLSADADMSVVERESYAFYKRALETGEHIAYLVYDTDRFIGAGGVSFYQVMPTYHNHSGKKAYIMNMYTAPEYRRQGIADHTLDLLVKEAKAQGVSQIALEAMDMGRPLYEKYGFVKTENEMELVQ